MKNPIQLSKFLTDNKQRTLQYLKNAFPALSFDDTEDVYQDSSLALYLNICNGKLNNLTSSLYTYFLRICINLSLKLLNKRERMLTVAIGDGGAGCRAIPCDMLEQAMLNEDESETRRIEERKQKLVNAIIVEMNEQCRHLLLGRYVDGYSWSSIAQRYGIANADTAKSIAYRCRKKFREKYHHLAAKIEGLTKD